MIQPIWGRPALAALFVVLAAPAQADAILQVVDRDDRTVAQLPFDGREICLEWAHSVTGGGVADCFVARDGRLVLMRSYLHDFAAGLGEVLGRGTLTSADGGGYWITGIDEVMPSSGLPLRVGAPRVGHRLRQGGDTINLSDLVANRRVTLRVVNN